MKAHTNSKTPKPSIKELLYFFSYDEKSGVLSWRNPRANKLKPGDRAGTVGHKNYRVVQLMGKHYREHHICWAISKGAWPINQIDHKNCDRGDNRISNLRECTGSENAKNRTLNKNSSSGYKGVSFHKASGKWAARIQVNKQRI